MNLSEFKSWFEGFTENLDAAPNDRQWKRIQEKVGKIKEAPPVTIQHFHDDYYRPWRRFYSQPFYSTSAIGQTYSTGFTSGQNQNGLQPMPYQAQCNAQQAAMQAVAAETFNSAAAFAELGRAEARSIR